MTQTAEHCVALVTVPDRETADRIAQALVTEGLAACVNVIPGVVSTYRWQGEIQRDDELLLVIKTRREKLDALQARVIELHPYDTPEVIALDITGGSPAYLNWITDNTR